MHSVKQVSNSTADVITAITPAGPRILLLGVGSLGCYLVEKTRLQLTVVGSGSEQGAQLAFALCHHKAALLQQKPGLHTFLIADANTPGSECVTGTLHPQHPDVKELKNLIQQNDLILLCGALGGDSGVALTEISQLCAKMQTTKQQGTLAFVVTPFSFEGGTRQQKAKTTLRQLENSCDALMVLPNDLLRTALGAKTKLEQALDASNSFLEAMLQQLLHLMARPSLINLDINDLLSLLKYRGCIAINWQSVDFSNPLVPQLLQLIQHPLLAKMATQTAKAALVHLEVPEHFELAHFELMHQELQRLLPENTLVLSGIRITPEINCPEVSLLLTGMTPDW